MIRVYFSLQVRSLNFGKLMGGGVLHTKFWIVDQRHVYIGSANMDWRSLTQVCIADFFTVADAPLGYCL